MLRVALISWMGGGGLVDVGGEAFGVGRELLHLGRHQGCRSRPGLRPVLRGQNSCSAATASPRDEVAICVTTTAAHPPARRIECSSQPTSSRERLRTFTVRSPFAMVSAATPRSSESPPDQGRQHIRATRQTGNQAYERRDDHDRTRVAQHLLDGDAAAASEGVVRQRQLAEDRPSGRVSVKLARKSWARRILRPISANVAVWRKRPDKVRPGSGLCDVTSHLWCPGRAPRAAGE